MGQRRCTETRPAKRVSLLGVFAGLAAACLATTLAASTGVASAATFGKTSVGASFEPDRANLKGVSRYALATAGSVSKLSVYLQPTGVSGQQAFQGVIYADSGGAPGGLLGTSSPLMFSSAGSARWDDLHLPTSLKL